MHIKVIAVAKLGRGSISDIIADYAKRLPWTLQWREIDSRKAMPVEARIREEATRMMAERRNGSLLIALDEKGKNLNSTDFAALFHHAQADGIRAVDILIGGADGLHETVRQSADHLISFGKLTWPHMLVRAMLAEQIYRAWSITAGHPYHRNG